MALRTRNIHVILLFAFFIQDLEEGLRLLHQDQPKTTMTLYRSQWMSKSEVDQMQTLIGQLISINSFFSTSRNVNAALMFLDSSSIPDSSRERVFFEIEVDTHVYHTKSFAYIASLSSYADEEEVLFAINNIFKVQSINREDQRTIIRLILCNTNEHKLTNVDAYMRSDQNENSLALGNVLLDMDELAEADRYYERISGELQSDDLATCYNQRGIIAGQRESHLQSIEYFNIAMSKTDPQDHFGFAGICHNMALAYVTLDKDTQGLYCFQHAIKNYRATAVPERYPKLAQCFCSIGTFYANKNNYEEAIKNFTTALNIYLKCCPHNYSDLGLCYMNICNAYADLGQPTKTVEYYDKSETLYLNSLPHDHPDLRLLYHNMARTFEETKDYSRAVVVLEKILSLLLETVPPTDSRVLNIQRDIERVKEKSVQAINDVP